MVTYTTVPREEFIYMNPHVFCCARIHASCKIRCQKLGFCYNDMHASMAFCHTWYPRPPPSLRPIHLLCFAPSTSFASPHRVLERRVVWVSGARGLKLDVELAHICATTPPPPMDGNRRIAASGARVCVRARKRILAQARGAGARGAGLKTHSTSSRRLGPGGGQVHTQRRWLCSLFNTRFGRYCVCNVEHKEQRNFCYKNFGHSQQREFRSEYL